VLLVSLDLRLDFDGEAFRFEFGLYLAPVPGLELEFVAVDFYVHLDFDVEIVVGHTSVEVRAVKDVSIRSVVTELRV